jgi:hypothetical protein
MTQSKYAIKGIHVFFGGKLHTAKDYVDASMQFTGWRDANGLGASDLSAKDGTIYVDGEKKARVSYNGRIWDLATGSSISASLRDKCNKISKMNLPRAIAEMEKLLDQTGSQEARDAVNYLREMAGMEPLKSKQEKIPGMGEPKAQPSGALVVVPANALVMPDNAAWTNRFKIKSESSDRMYTIAQNKKGRFWGCDCPGWVGHGGQQCKHLRALGLPGNRKPFEASLKLPAGGGAKEEPKEEKRYEQQRVFTRPPQQESEGGLAVVRVPSDSEIMPDNASWTNRFQIKSETSDRLYTIAQNKHRKYWACSCPGWIGHRKCKHLTALGLPNKEQPFEATLKQGSKKMGAGSWLDPEGKLPPAPDYFNQNYERVGDNKARCKRCGEDVICNIVGLGEHDRMAHPKKTSAELMHSDNDLNLKMEPATPTSAPQVPGPEAGPSNDELHASGHAENGENGSPVFDGKMKHPERQNVNAIREALETQVEMEVGKPIQQKQEEMAIKEKVQDAAMAKGLEPGQVAPGAAEVTAKPGTQIIINVASENIEAPSIGGEHQDGATAGHAGGAFGGTDLEGPSFHVGFVLKGHHREVSFSSLAAADKFVKEATTKFKIAGNWTMKCPWCGGQASKDKPMDTWKCDCGWTSDKDSKKADGPIPMRDQKQAADADPAKRQLVLEMLKQGPKTTGELEKALGGGKYTNLAYPVMQALAQEGLVKHKKMRWELKQASEMTWHEAKEVFAKNAGYLTIDEVKKAGQEYLKMVRTAAIRVSQGQDDQGFHMLVDMNGREYVLRGQDADAFRREYAAIPKPEAAVNKLVEKYLWKLQPYKKQQIQHPTPDKTRAEGLADSDAYWSGHEKGPNDYKRYMTPGGWAKGQHASKNAYYDPEGVEGYSNYSTYYMHVLMHNEPMSDNIMHQLVEHAIETGETAEQLGQKYQKFFKKQLRQMKREHDENAAEIRQDRGAHERRQLTGEPLPSTGEYAKDMANELWDMRHEVGMATVEEPFQEPNWTEIAETELENERAERGIEPESKTITDKDKELGKSMGIKMESSRKKAGEGMAKTEEQLEKEAGFNFFFPGQVLKEFYPEIQHEIVDYPNATNQPMNTVNPEIVGETPQGDLEGMLDSALDTSVVEMIQLPGDIGDVEPLEMAASKQAADYVSTDVGGSMGIGRDGKPEVLEGAPLRKENDIRGYMFTDEFYGQYDGVNGAALQVASMKTAAGDEPRQFAMFLKRVCGEICATMIAAFKVTSRPLLDKVPGVGEIQLDQIEQGSQPMPMGVSTQGGRVKYLMDKLNDGDIKAAINEAWAQGAVWHDGANGGFVYEVFVRPETIDTDSMKMVYKFVCGTRE